MLDDECPQAIELMGAESVALRQLDRLQPKLRNPVTMLDMNVRRLSPFQAIAYAPIEVSPRAH